MQACCVACDRQSGAELGSSCMYNPAHTACWPIVDVFCKHAACIWPAAYRPCSVRLQILQRINDEIEARRQAGDDLPPPPKTALAGPEYFGLNQVEVTTLEACQSALQIRKGCPGCQMLENVAARPHTLTAW